MRYEVSGVIHCHSTYSDGMEPIPVIAEAANRAGLDFLIMTDHDTLVPLTDIGEQWHGDTLLLLGCEISPRHNHYLAYGITNSISPHFPPLEYTEAVARQGGIGFLAHPHEQGSRFLRQNSYTWEDWSVTDYTGMEIWNYFSEWIGACRNLPSTVVALTNWRRVIRAPQAKTLAKWDELGKLRRVVGIGGMDAHGIKRKVMGSTVVLHPYERSFRALRTHLLLAAPFTRSLAADRQLVLDALREGSCFFANHEEGNPAGFTFLGRHDASWVHMGQEVTTTTPGEVHFSVRIPYRHHGKPSLRLLKDGQVIAEAIDCDLQGTDQGPGVYRVEAWQGQRGWIFSNPIYVRG
jgi:hypothetical protein